MDDFALPCSLVLLKPVAPTEYPIANVLVCVVSTGPKSGGFLR
jgi:hypothetical protein